MNLKDALAEIEKWKDASGLECGGDPDGVTPDACREYWGNIESIAQERDDAVNCALNLRQDLDLVKRQVRNMTRACNEQEWHAALLEMDNGENWYVIDDTDNPQPIAIVPRGRDVAEDIAHLKAMSRPWWGVADEFVAAEADWYRDALQAIAEHDCGACECAEMARKALSRYDGSAKITDQKFTSQMCQKVISPVLTRRELFNSQETVNTDINNDSHADFEDVV
jgi:hypothetical protein